MLQNTLAQEGGGYSGGSLMGGAYSGGCAPRKSRRAYWDSLSQAQKDEQISKMQRGKLRKSGKARDYDRAFLQSATDYGFSEMNPDGSFGSGMFGGGTRAQRDAYLKAVKDRTDDLIRNWVETYRELFNAIGAPSIPISKRDSQCISNKIREQVIAELPAYVKGK